MKKSLATIFVASALVLGGCGGGSSSSSSSSSSNSFSSEPVTLDPIFASPVTRGFMLQDASVIIQNNSQDFNKVLLDSSFDTSFGVGGVATISSTLVYKRAYASDSSGNFYIYGLGNGSDQYI